MTQEEFKNRIKHAFERYQDEEYMYCQFTESGGDHPACITIDGIYDINVLCEYFCEEFTDNNIKYGKLNNVCISEGN
jgi:hypothetical protein